MKRSAKIIRWVSGAAIVFAAVLTIFILIAPRLINIEYVRQVLVSTLSQKIGGEVNFQNIRLSILPRPHLAIFDGRLSVPETFQASWKSLSLSVRLLPLFRGRIDVGTVTVEHPEITLTVAPDDGRHQPVPAVAEKTSPLAGVAAAIGLTPAVNIKAGRLNLHIKDRFSLIFIDMNGRVGVSADRMRIRLKTRTDFCERIELQAESDLRTFNSRGRISLARIRSQHLPPNLFAADASWLGESLINLDLDFETDGLKTVAADVQGSMPQLTLLRGGNPVVLAATSFKGRFHQDDRQIAVFLTEGILEHPKLTLSGKYVRERAGGQMEVELKAADVEVTSTRRTALALAGETPAVKEIFGIIRGGRLSAFILSSRGRSLADLAELKNMTLTGNLKEGAIVVPGIDLKFEDVRTEVRIRNGILTAEGIRARYDTTTILDGSLRLGLWGATAPFHLDIGLDADLTQVPPILKQVVKDRRVLKEIDSIAVVDGRAGGRLILGETLNNVTATVNVSDFTLTARVAPILAALIIKGNALRYSGAGVSIERLEGKLENSGFFLGPGRLNWRQTPVIDIQAGRADLKLNEIHTILSTFASLRNALKNIQSMNGTVALSRFQLSGPLAEPSKWEFQAEGTARNAEVKSAQLPAPLSVSRGEFKATPQALTISQAESGMLDAALTVSGRLTEYLGAIQTADLRFEGAFGSEGNQWLQQKIKMPSHLTIRPPLHFLNSRLLWQRSGPAAFSGDLTLPDDLNVSADVVLETDRIHIKKLTVRDKDSNAAFALKLQRGKEIDFGFKGNLQKTTVTKLLADNRILDGRINGDLRLTYAIDRPLDTRFEGTLSGEDLIFMKPLGLLLKVKNFDVAGIDGKFDVAAEMLLERDQEIKLTGQVNHSPHGIIFDAAVSSGGMVLDDLAAVTGRDDQNKAGAPKDRFWEFPLKGVVKLDSAYAAYGKYTWRPLRGTLSLKPDKITFAVDEAEVCGISMPGVITMTPQDVRLKFEPFAREQEIKKSIVCLLDKDAEVEGRFNLDGGIAGGGPGRDLQKALTGDLTYQTGKGRIYSGNAFQTISRIFAVLNVTEIFRGKLPEVGKEGFGFNSIQAKLKIRDGVLELEEGVIDGLTANMTARGVLNLADRQMDLTVLVAPFKTVDSIVRIIPLVGEILGGSLISVPIGVKGDLQNPAITVLSPAAVGEGLLGILTRTLKLPVKIIEPFIPREKKQNSN